MDIEKEILNLYSGDLHKIFSINEIAKRLNRPYGTVYNALQGLIKLKVIEGEQKGRSTLCSLNLNSNQARFILAAGSISGKEKFEKKAPVLAKALREIAENLKQRLKYNLISLVLFGSLAKGEGTKRSDIDLLVVVPDKRLADEVIHRECNTLEMRYGRSVNPVIVTPEILVGMIKFKGENVGKEILRGSVIFEGFEKFWDLVIEGAR